MQSVCHYSVLSSRYLSVQSALAIVLRDNTDSDGDDDNEEKSKKKVPGMKLPSENRL